MQPMPLTLFDKPSEFILLALKDLQECENDSSYVISMGQWHKPSPMYGVCFVCLAGAVMAKTFGFSNQHDAVPTCIVYHPPQNIVNDVVGQQAIVSKLTSLNNFRKGEIRKGLYTFYAGMVNINEDVPDRMYVRHYSLERREEFYQDMQQVVTLLEQYGY